MMDFKKAILFSIENIKWYYLVFIFILACLSMISDTMALVSAILVLLFGTGIIGTKLIGKLKTLKQSTVPILKNTGKYTIVTIIFLVVQYILLIIGMIPFMLIATNLGIGALSDSTNFETLLYSTPGWLLLVAIVVFLIFLAAAIFLEIIKVMGMSKYFKTGKFGDAFKIGKYFKAIFTKDYLIILVFIFGLVFAAILKIIVITYLVSLFSNTAALLIAGVLIVLFLYIITGCAYSLVSDYIVDKK